MTRRLLALGVIAALVACNPKSPNTGVSASPSLAPHATPSPLSLRVSGSGTAKRPVRFVETKQNRKQFEILTRSFQSHGASGNVMLTYNDVRIKFFGKDGSILNATAPRATVDQSTNLVKMLGGVHANNSNGTTLQCDTLTYDRSTEMVYGDGNVIMTNSNGFRGTGTKFQSDVSLTNAQMQ